MFYRNYRTINRLKRQNEKLKWRTPRCLKEKKQASENENEREFSESNTISNKPYARLAVKWSLFMR